MALRARPQGTDPATEFAWVDQSNQGRFKGFIEELDTNWPKGPEGPWGYIRHKIPGWSQEGIPALLCPGVA